MVLLANDGLLPLAAGGAHLRRRPRRGAAAAYGRSSSSRATPTSAIVFRNAPYEPRNGNFIESLFHAGSLDFPADERDRVLEVAQAVPTILVVHLDRPAILTELADACGAVVGTFGASPEAILDLVFGRFSPDRQASRSSCPRRWMRSAQQLSDVPCDSERPLFPLGHGLTFRTAT